MDLKRITISMLTSSITGGSICEKNMSNDARFHICVLGKDDDLRTFADDASSIGQVDHNYARSFCFENLTDFPEDKRSDVLKDQYYTAGDLRWEMWGCLHNVYDTFEAHKPEPVNGKLVYDVCKRGEEFPYKAFCTIIKKYPSLEFAINYRGDGDPDDRQFFHAKNGKIVTHVRYYSSHGSWFGITDGPDLSSKYGDGKVQILEFFVPKCMNLLSSDNRYNQGDGIRKIYEEEKVL